MKLICKQCGKEFELSESEIDFYKSRNLHIPKRCEQCRKANKKNKSASVKPYKKEDKQNEGMVIVPCENAPVQGRSYMPSGGSSGWNSGRNNKWIYAALIAAILFSVGGIVLSHWDLFNGYSGVTEPLYDEDVYASGEMHNQTEADAEQSDVVSAPLYTFRNSNLLNEHFEKHGKEMGFETAEEYQAAASSVATSEDALHKLEKEDGDDVYYIESSNDFVIISTDGYIRTYFKPDNGIEYYDKQ